MLPIECTRGGESGGRFISRDVHPPEFRQRECAGADAPRAAENLSIHRCSDVVFRNLTIDMKPLPFTVGTITAVESGNQIVIEILPGYPEPDESYDTANPSCRSS